MRSYRFYIVLISLSTLLIPSTLEGQKTQSVLPEVSKEIRSDGIRYFVQQTEGFDQLSRLKLLFEKMEHPHLKEYIDLMADLSRLQDDMGLQDIDAYGYSVAKEGDLFDMDYFAHLKSGNNKALLWKFMGGEAKKFKTFDLLPDNTLLSLTLRIDLLSLYNYIKTTLPLIKTEGLEAFREELEELEIKADQSGMPVPTILEALSTEFTIFISLNEAATMELPDLGEMPQLAIGLIIEKKSELLADFLRQHVETQFKPVMNGVYNTVQITEVLPTGTNPGYALNKEYGIFSSDFNVVKKIMTMKPDESLVKSDEFSKYQKMSRKGNMAFYLSSDISEFISTVIKDIPNEYKYMEPLILEAFFKGVEPGFFGVFSKKTNGLKIDTRSNFKFPGNTFSDLLLILLPGVEIMTEVIEEIEDEEYEVERQKERAVYEERRRKQQNIKDEEERKQFAMKHEGLLRDFDPDHSLKKYIPENITKDYVDVSRATVGSIATIEEARNWRKTVAVIGRLNGHKLVELTASYMRDPTVGRNTAIILEVDDSGKVLKAWGGIVGFEAKAMSLPTTFPERGEMEFIKSEVGAVIVLGMRGVGQTCRISNQVYTVWKNKDFPFFGGVIQTSFGRGAQVIQYEKSGAQAQIKIK